MSEVSFKSTTSKMKFNKTYLTLALILFLIEIWIAFIIKDGFIRYTFGDYLVVIFLYCLIRGFTNLSVLTTVLLVGFIAFTIEFLQLVNLLEFLNVQHNRLAKLILGSTFHITDLIAYTIGLITVIIIEHIKS